MNNGFISDNFQNFSLRATYNVTYCTAKRLNDQFNEFIYTQFFLGEINRI